MTVVLVVLLNVSYFNLHYVGQGFNKDDKRQLSQLITLILSVSVH